jgi:glutaredoxin
MNYVLYAATAVAAYYLFFKKRSAAPPGTITFYTMNGCPHCEKLKPKWDAWKASCRLPTREVEASQNNEVELRGYPTVLLTDSMGFASDIGRSPESWSAACS